jgi:sugar/nucleoside kinase (ribokinase family)
MLILVGTACTWSAASAEDFDLLSRIIQAAHGAGTTVLCDLGGLGSWGENALASYFAVLNAVDILSMNESELGVYYHQKTGEPSVGVRAGDLAAMARGVARPGQGCLVHSPAFQLGFGLDSLGAAGSPEAALTFAGRAASCRAQLGRFPTAREVMAADLPVSANSREELAGLPPDFVSVPGYDIVVRNPVGLGDTWTCAFALAILGGD